MGFWLLVRGVGMGGGVAVEEGEEIIAADLSIRRTLGVDLAVRRLEARTLTVKRLEDRTLER